MAADKLFTHESLLASVNDHSIENFWKNGFFGEFKGKGNIRINFCQFSDHNFDKTVVIVPGRVETYLKYKELAYEFHQQKFNVFILDHRGQGLSQRLIKNRFKGYVASFSDYVEDLHGFIELQVLPHCQHKPYLLAHSMGGAVSCRYLQVYPEVVQAAVLSSPMMAINSGRISHGFANAVVNIHHKLNRLFSKEAWYFLGQSDYKISPFKHNHLMQSPVRYGLFIQLYQQIPRLQLGGVTTKWLLEAEKVRKQIFTQITQLSCPIAILQASEDTIVDIVAQDEFCQQLHQVNNQSCPDGKPMVIDGARHEILFEKDIYRKQALTYILAWFANH